MVLRDIDAGGTVFRAAIEAGDEELEREVLAAVEAVSAAFGEMEFLLADLARAAGEIHDNLAGQGTELRTAIEEVARIHGYHHIPEDQAVPLTSTVRGARERVESAVRHLLAGAGFDEAVTFSLVDERLGAPVRPGPACSPRLPNRPAPPSPNAISTTAAAASMPYCRVRWRNIRRRSCLIMSPESNCRCSAAKCRDSMIQVSPSCSGSAPGSASR